MTTNHNNRHSLNNLADELIVKTRNIAKRAKSEEDLKIGFEKILEPILKTLGIKPSPKYEKSIFKAGRSDALHGQVVIEYEPPKAFRSQRAVNHAYDQLVGYLQGLSQADKETLFIFESKFIGVGFDGERIFFVRYKGDKEEAKSELKKTDFVLVGPFDFSTNSARTLLTHLRALARVPLTAENLAEKFGPESTLAPKAVSAFAESLENWGTERVKVFFNEWKRLFGIVYGETFTGHQKKEAKALSKLYKVGKETDFQELLFAVHTYFAFLMKLIVAELLTLRETELTSSLASQLTHLSEDELKAKLEDIENGGVYSRRGITNFLEGDFFRWYLDAWWPRLKEAIQEIARALSEFEPATSTIAPEATRDLLKKLYQYLVPQEVRHRLGEYYTPDWLAELVLNEVDYKGDTLKKLLDPACGSGTFLVLAIQRAKEHGKKEKLSSPEIAKRIVANIWGFDLNPLAVIAARTNYLFALGDLTNELDRIEIPIYLTDSVLTPIRTTGNLFGEFLEVSTSIGKFQVPAEWVKDRGALLSHAAPLVEEMAKNQYSTEEAIKRFKKEKLIFPDNEQIVRNFYAQLLELEKQNKNGIWARFLKNSFAPMIAGKFDFVVGNPPWIRWEYLSREYRDATTPLLKNYGLYQTKDFASRNLGVGVKDFSMLFTYAAADYYLKDKAKLGFLITQEVFKAKGAGEGFRKFQFNNTYFKVIKTHDLVDVKPFEGAANKTAIITLTKGKTTEYPVPYFIWTRKKGVGKIPTDILFSEAVPLLEKSKFIALPLGTKLGPWQTMPEDQKEIRKIEEKNEYQAWRGVETDPYGVYLLDIKQVLSNNDLIIKNLVELGKKKIEKIEERIESDLVYPAIRGKDIQRWLIKPQIFVLFPVDSNKKEPYPESLMKERWPRTYGYFVRFRENLLSRGSKAARMLAERSAFYAMLGYGSYTTASYKVIWKRMANDIFAAVSSHRKTPFGFKTSIPLGTTSLFKADSESEAHYLCAIINSIPVRDFIKSFSSAGRGFGTPSVMERVGIPKFDPKNKLHLKLAQISKKCHQLKIENEENEIQKLEKENNKHVRRLFDLKD